MKSGAGVQISAPNSKSMDIENVCNIIHKIAEGFDANAMKCLEYHSGNIVVAIQEQIYSGQNGKGEHLSPTYDTDPYFEQDGPWYHRAHDYKAWKQSITPPVTSSLLGLPPRPDNVPNLFINGKFFSEITATRRGDMLYVNPGSGNGPKIVAKYGDSLLDIGDSAVAYFNREYMWPAIEKYFNDCGYR